jgi:hypothetical protein
MWQHDQLGRSDLRKPNANVSAWLALMFPSTLCAETFVARLVFIWGSDQFLL